MSSQVYYNGDFWDAVAVPPAGDTPGTTPENWSKIEIPRRWRSVLSRLTYAHLLELDGQSDKSAIEQSRGMAALDDLVREFAGNEAWRDRTQVQLR